MDKKTITLLLDSDTYKKLKEDAEKIGSNTSEYIRIIILKYYKKI